MAANLEILCDDLLLETQALVEVLSALNEGAWLTATPAPGWSVHDQLTHLSYFDEIAIQTVVDPDAFLQSRSDALADVDTFTMGIADMYRRMPSREVLSWFRESRRTLIEVFRVLDPRARVPWYGPDMSVASALTARIMETWAHGQDIVDGLAVKRDATRALQHVAYLGVNTFANSFQANGLPVPVGAVSVDVLGPNGESWSWGNEGEENRVSGAATDFCLVVTQRRHLEDTALSVEGPVAREWMNVAQAFAGPPGAGRQPGQFPKIDQG